MRLPGLVRVSDYVAMRARAIRRSGGSDVGGTLRGGNSASNSRVAAVTTDTARSKASAVASEVFWTPLTFRTYWRAAASISSGVADGSSPRSVVMFLHMPMTVRRRPLHVDADIVPPGLGRHTCRFTRGRGALSTAGPRLENGAANGVLFTRRRSRVASDAMLSFSVLGPLAVARGDELLDLGHPKQRAVLALLVMHANTPRTADRIIDDLWGERPPRSATATLQAYVSNLRRVLEPDRPVRAPATVLTSTNGGYQLNAEPTTLDHVRFASAVQHAVGLADTDPAAARTIIVEALALWRGQAYADFQYEAFAENEISRLDELRNTAVETRIACDLELGRASELVPELDALVQRYPMRERLRLHQMTALYRAGRQTDALASYEAYADQLREHLGLDPSRALSDLHLAVLEHDPKLLASSPPHRSTATPAAAASVGPPHVVGREDEHRMFDEALVDAAGGVGSILLLDGEAGVGKTRLLERLYHRASTERMVTAFARCVEVGGTPPFWPWAQLVRQLDPDIVASAAGAYGAQLGPLLPPDERRESDESSSLFNVAAGLTTAFRTLGVDSPVVLFLDDLYSSDPDSLSLLTLIGAELDRLPVVIVGTHRGVELGSAHPLTVALGHLARFGRVRRHSMRRFGPTEVAEIVRNVVGDEIDASVIDAIHDRTDGNAFFTVELTKLLATTNQLKRDGALNEVPATIRAVIDQRIDGLTADTVRVLRVAAVAGREFDLATIREVLEMSVGDAAGAAEEARRAGLIDETDRPEILRFAHIIVVDAVVHSLGSVRRAQLHDRLADALERPGLGSPVVWTSIAHHRVKAIPVSGATAAIESLARAGHHAMQSDALELAEQLFEQRRALVDDYAVSSPDNTQPIAALLDLIRVWTRREGYHSRRISDASEALWDAVGRRGATISLDDLGPVSAEHPVLCGLQAQFSNVMVRGDIVGAVEVAGRCLELADAHPEPFLVFTANLNAMVALIAAGDVEPMLRASERASAALDVIDPDHLGLVTLPLGQQSARVALHAFSGWAYVLAGDRERADREFAAARRCCDRLRSAFNTGFCVAVECEAAATARAPDWTIRVLEWGRADVTRGLFGLWDVWLAVLGDWAHGMSDDDPLGAADRIRANLERMRDEDARVVHSLFWLLTATLEQRAGHVERALDAAQRGLDHVERFGERFCAQDLERLHERLAGGLAIEARGEPLEGSTSP